MKTCDESLFFVPLNSSSKKATIQGKKKNPVTAGGVLIFFLCSCHLYTDAPFTEFCGVDPADLFSPSQRRKLKETLMV